MNALTKTIISAALLLAGLTLNGCKNDLTDNIASGNIEAEAAPLVDTYWKLTGISELDILPAGLGFEPHLVLTSDGMVKGHSGCNRFFGGYLREEDTLSFKQVAATRMACPDVASIEYSFHRVLKTAGSFRIHGDQLFLETENGVSLATFKASEPAQHSAQL